MCQVEIECADCHGRPDKFAWELHLGYGGEYGKQLNDQPHGVAGKPLQLGCHQNMTVQKLWEKVSEKGKLDPEQHLEMMNKMIKYMAEKAQKGTDW
jgi:hypothetical protein